MSRIGAVKCANSPRSNGQQPPSQIIIKSTTTTARGNSSNNQMNNTRRRTKMMMMRMMIDEQPSSRPGRRTTSRLQVAVSLASYCLALATTLALVALYQHHPNYHQSRFAQVSAFPSGAPESACKDLKPGHGGDAASGAAPFELTQDKLQVEAGDQIKVTLSSPSGTNFKGLIVQALNEKGEPAKSGKFIGGVGLKTLDSCSAVTHSDKNAKKTATLVWEAASDLKSKEAFTFKATVVQKFDEFYMNIKSTLGTASKATRR